MKPGKKPPCFGCGWVKTPVGREVNELAEPIEVTPGTAPEEAEEGALASHCTCRHGWEGRWAIRYPYNLL